MIKKFEQFNDPYGEEVDDDLNHKASWQNIDNLKLIDGNTNTKYTLKYKFNEFIVIFEVWYDDIGYDRYEIYNEEDLPDYIRDFLYENNHEIRVILENDVRNGRF